MSASESNERMVDGSIEGKVGERYMFKIMIVAQDLEQQDLFNGENHFQNNSYNYTKYSDNV